MMLRMRLCHFGDQLDLDSKPSGSYLQLATTANIFTKLWQCKCGMPIQEHTLDRYGRGEAHADWRKKTTVKFIKEIVIALDLRGNVHPEAHVILDNATPPLPITATALPTEARIRQKERLTKMKELGLKLEKKQKHTEPGNDDCATTSVD